MTDSDRSHRSASTNTRSVRVILSGAKDLAGQETCPELDEGFFGLRPQNDSHGESVQDTTFSDMSDTCRPDFYTKKENHMKHYSTHVPQSPRCNLLLACATALALAFTVSLPAHADRVTPPAVPANLQVPAGHKVFFVGHAVGTQQYICLSPSGETPWAFFGPQATLFADNEKQLTTHFLSPNPSPDDPLGSDTPRPTWQHSKDTSTVWAAPIASSSDSAFVAADAIPWLLLEVVGAEEGPTGGDKLTAATFIQRLNTFGGVAPLTDCIFGQKELVPYEADYFFYKAAKGNAGGGN